MNTNDSLSRRRVLAGTMGAGLLAAGLIAGGGFQGALAQDEATPDATADATPADGVGGTESDTDETEEESVDSTATSIERATAAIDAAQGDREAVADLIDSTTVDALLGQATDLRDRAQTAAAGGDTDSAHTLAKAAASTAQAAGALVAAQLQTVSLPSQAAPASHTLASAYETIQSVGEATTDATDADVAFSLTTAQALYQTAYDLYGVGIYGQAAATAAVGARLARVASYLAAPVGDDRSDAGRGGPSGRSDGRNGGSGMDRNSNVGGDRDGSPDTSAEPVEVPEPSF